MIGISFLLQHADTTIGSPLNSPYPQYLTAFEWHITCYILLSSFMALKRKIRQDSTLSL